MTSAQDKDWEEVSGQAFDTVMGKYPGIEGSYGSFKDIEAGTWIVYIHVYLPIFPWGTDTTIYHLGDLVADFDDFDFKVVSGPTYIPGEAMREFDEAGGKKPICGYFMRAEPRQGPAAK